ncbi:(S)-coclaurine N-methyltransferase [Linum perenne]
MEGLIQIPYNASVKLMLGSMERNILPDIVVRSLTRLLLGVRLRWGYKSCAELQLSQLLNFVHSLKDMPIAIQTEKPKEQHYEVPTSFFKLVLGKNLKYSCCYFSDKTSSLENAEDAMLELYCERSELKDGQSVLDVGCGWGSLALYIAQKYSNCKVTGICNSTTQKAFIEDQCRDRQLQNVEIIVADISTFEMDASFDRIYSIEMFEHMKNYRDLLNKISRWMNQDGRLFVHQYFFSGGTMPSTNLLLYFQVKFAMIINNEEWLKRMDKNMGIIKPIMASTYGKDEALKWTVYWRTFFMAVAELFRYNNGEEWLVTHYLFKKK